MSAEIELQTPDIILEKAREAIKNNESSPGRFFRYMPIEQVAHLVTQGSIEVQGVSEFSAVVSEEYNPKHIAPEIIFSYYFLSAIHGYVTPLELFSQWEKKMRLFDESIPIISQLQEVEQTLVNSDQKFEGLVWAVQECCTQKSTMPAIEYLKKIGGTRTMIELKRSGWGVKPDGAFSDLFPLSVGAPMGQPVGNKVCVLELDFDRSELCFPDDDRNNEHEVMTQIINLRNLRGIYSEKNWGHLWTKLETTFPDYFQHDSSEALLTFARNKPLEELLSELAI